MSQLLWDFVVGFIQQMSLTIFLVCLFLIVLRQGFVKSSCWPWTHDDPPSPPHAPQPPVCWCQAYTTILGSVYSCLFYEDLDFAVSSQLCVLIYSTFILVLSKTFILKIMWDLNRSSPLPFLSGCPTSLYLLCGSSQLILLSTHMTFLGAFPQLLTFQHLLSVLWIELTPDTGCPK